jgi:hypothetical protein
MASILLLPDATELVLASIAHAGPTRLSEEAR